MKALVFNGPKQLDYETYDDPKIEDSGNMVIKVEHCSICGSDLHLYHGGVIGAIDYSQPVKPFCVGHEAIGEVVDVGKSVKNHKVGDRVIVSAGAGCGKCRRCRMGQINQCELVLQGKGASPYGVSTDWQGAQAEYMQVNDADIGAVKIPEELSVEQSLLLTDALATGYFGVKSARVEPGNTVAVIGQGPVGIMAAEAAVAVGASRVYAIDPLEVRRNKALKFGAIPLAPENVETQIFEDTHGVGVDVVIDAVGITPTITQGITVVRFGGRIAVLGIIQPDAQFPMHVVQMKNVMVHSGLASPQEYWAELIPMMQAGLIKGEGVFTHQFPLAEGAEAFRMFDAHEDGVMKVLLTP